MVTTTLPAAVEISQIPYVTADEAYALMSTEVQRLIRLAEALDETDWLQPTACTAWRVREVLAHQAGGYATGASFIEMLRQYAAIPRSGQLMEDIINDRQVGARASYTPGDLIDEIRRFGPPAAKNWAYGFNFIKWISVPHPHVGNLSMRHLMWVIHSRDTWMHRLDIQRATGKPFEQSAEHDGRIVALVIQDVARQIAPRLTDTGIAIELSGIAGGRWKIGSGQVAATLAMDALDFNVMVSRRTLFTDVADQMRITGDAALIDSLFRDLIILY